MPRRRAGGRSNCRGRKRPRPSPPAPRPGWNTRCARVFSTSGSPMWRTPSRRRARKHSPAFTYLPWMMISSGSLARMRLPSPTTNQRATSSISSVHSASPRAAPSQTGSRPISSSTPPRNRTESTPRARASRISPRMRFAETIASKQPRLPQLHSRPVDGVHRHVADLPRQALVAPQQLAVQDDPRAEPLVEGVDDDEVSRPVGHALLPLRDRLIAVHAVDEDRHLAEPPQAPSQQLDEGHVAAPVRVVRGDRWTPRRTNPRAPGGRRQCR